MPGIAENLKAVCARIDAAGRKYGRLAGSTGLLAVSKTWPAASVRAAFAAGQRAFGENYVQEAVDKMAELRDLPIEWHFIGPLQSNKTRLVAENFAWVHSVDRLKIAQRLSEQRPEALSPLKLCLQVNVSGEASKSGVTPGELPALAAAVAQLPGIELVGLMAIPEPSEDEALLRSRFRQLVGLRDGLREQLDLPLETLSMGMSDDLELAIAEGSTLVRVGSAIFGTRQKNQ
ncbi:YggS family pyridoxal phosphate-dependent enzyme [Uliginosibacterium sp. TH139]|uniref:YggS family pyridoxal phosphate-dependent enzyme n=1 Tax=Uliginosibacterium sp. TH139 TaxID=2067453 RepID=UPI000C7B2220|nr:YggS family pyridoxal phosphate-dependent enzyme [Uliginosibacterium sp. TH139]PLK50034.1 YggS family pyridoxal phosphate-dependent enzyme [Uliginosibacterium sp. TH139]